MENIWTNFNFDENRGKSIKDYLNDEIDNLYVITKGHLKMSIESFFDGKKTKHRFNIILPHLGNYRKSILTITEIENCSYFPVTIEFNAIGEDKIKNISEEEILISFKEAISKNKIIIETLYRQSLEANENRK